MKSFNLGENSWLVTSKDPEKSPHMSLLERFFGRAAKSGALNHTKFADEPSNARDLNKRSSSWRDLVGFSK